MMAFVGEQPLNIGLGLERRRRAWEPGRVVELWGLF